MDAAAAAGCTLVAFGEALVPGYPFWIERTDGARFNSALQKEFHAAYLEQAVQIEAGHLDGVCAAARRHGIAVILGIIERPAVRSARCIENWSPGDGHGLVVHPLGAFTVGALNCWENWMPLPRAALYGQGEDLHVALWPGGEHNTRDITRFVALESRS